MLVRILPGIFTRCKNLIMFFFFYTKRNTRFATIIHSVLLTETKMVRWLKLEKYLTRILDCVTSLVGSWQCFKIDRARKIGSASRDSVIALVSYRRTPSKRCILLRSVTGSLCISRYAAGVSEGAVDGLFTRRGENLRRYPSFYCLPRPAIL